MVGNSGEYFVVASLLKRGIIAGLVPRNTAHFDLDPLEKSALDDYLKCGRK